jgi:hypothetical protein
MAAAPAAPRGTAPRTRDSQDEVARVTRYLERLSADGFYGKVVISFQNGRPCDVKIEQTRKVDEL